MLSSEVAEAELVTLLGRRSGELGVLPSKFGFASKQGHVVRRWRRRWLVLARLSLLYYSDMDSSLPQGGVSLANLRMVLAEDTLFLVCSVSYTVRPLSGLSRLTGRTLALRGLSSTHIAQWRDAIAAAIAALALPEARISTSPAPALPTSAPPPVPRRTARQSLARVGRPQSARAQLPELPERLAQFRSLLTGAESAAVSRINEEFIFRIRSSNMDEHV